MSTALNRYLLTKLADQNMIEPYPFIRGFETDATLGRTFVMPTLRPLSFMHDKDIPLAQSLDLIRTQHGLLGEHNVETLTNGMRMADPANSSGLISTSDIIRGLIGAGVGAAAGWGLGHILGTVLSQPAPVKAKMAHYGALGGALLNSGLLPAAGRAIFNTYGND